MTLEKLNLIFDKVVSLLCYLLIISCLLVVHSTAATAENKLTPVIAESFSVTGKVKSTDSFEQEVSDSKTKRRRALPVTVDQSENLMTCGSSSRCVDLVFLSDGFTTEELPQYKALVDRAVKKLFSVQPFKTYKQFFNVSRVDVSSNQSGLSPNLKNLKDTAFLTYPGCSRGTTALCSDLETIKEVADSTAFWDYALVIANDQKSAYGIAYPGYNISIVTGDSKILPNTVIHELGHLIGKLGDEYEYWGPINHSKSESGYPNITVKDKNKWKEWTKKKVSKDYDGPTGLYEGAEYSKRGVFRPSPNSRMRDSSRPFNAPSAEAIILDIFSHTLPKGYNGVSGPDVSIPSASIVAPTDFITFTPPNFPYLKTRTKWEHFTQSGLKKLNFNNTVDLSQVDLKDSTNYLTLEVVLKHPFFISKYSQQTLGNLRSYWYPYPEALIAPPVDVSVYSIVETGVVEISFSPLSTRQEQQSFQIFRSQNGKLCQDADLLAYIAFNNFTDYTAEFNTEYTYSFRATDSRGFSECVDGGTTTLSIVKTKIESSPKSATTIVGHHARFRVLATGTKLRYNWYENSVLLPFESENVLNIEATPEKNGNIYVVEVVGENGTVQSKPVTLTVKTPLYPSATARSFN